MHCLFRRKTPLALSLALVDTPARCICQKTALSPRAPVVIPILFVLTIVMFYGLFGRLLNITLIMISVKSRVDWRLGAEKTKSPRFRSQANESGGEDHAGGVAETGVAVALEDGARPRKSLSVTRTTVLAPVRVCNTCPIRVSSFEPMAVFWKSVSMCLRALSPNNRL